MGLKKNHTSDAFVISRNFNAKRIEYQYLKRLVRRHNRQIHKMKILKGGKKKNNQAPLRFSDLDCLIKYCITMKYSLFMEEENQEISISGISTEKIQRMFHTKSLNSLEERGIRLY